MRNKKKKFLHIELKEDIRNVVDKYCEKTGIDRGSIAFAMGFISGIAKDDPIVMQQLTFVLQAYFFSGVFYARDQADKLSYRYLTHAERETEIAKKHKKCVHNPLPMSKGKPSYVG